MIYNYKHKVNKIISFGLKEQSMKIQSISSNNYLIEKPNQVSFNSYRDLSKLIEKSNRKELISIAEYFHNASEDELHQITKSSPKAYKLIKEVVNGVITRKKCYMADGAGYLKKLASDLDTKASKRYIFYMA